MASANGKDDKNRRFSRKGQKAKWGREGTWPREEVVREKFGTLIERKTTKEGPPIGVRHPIHEAEEGCIHPQAGRNMLILQRGEEGAGKTGSTRAGAEKSIGRGLKAPLVLEEGEKEIAPSQKKHRGELHSMETCEIEVVAGLEPGRDNFKGGKPASLNQKAKG